MNRFTLIGNLGKKPELYTMDNGNKKCHVSVATSKRVKNGDNWEKATMWTSVTLFGQSADFATKYLVKGQTVIVEGTVEDKKTDNGFKTYVTGKSIEAVGRAPSESGAGVPAESQAPTLDSVDIPF